MTESEWWKAWSANDMLSHLSKHARITRTPAGRRKLRLFGCACIRRVWRLLTDERSREAVELGERYADGRATAQQLKQAERPLSSPGLGAGARTTRCAAACGEPDSRVIPR